MGVKKGTPKMVREQLLLPPALAEVLQDRANEIGLNKSEITRRALTAYLEKEAITKEAPEAA
ncbi:hypothetical protein PQR75_06510 [Paraburkholderia fungorum]|uniref:hypothetical protein n=1 Tax=Paraburkholderia fungorum TaxID=134537 RepID=UPI0038BC40B2